MVKAENGQPVILSVYLELGWCDWLAQPTVSLRRSPRLQPRKITVQCCFLHFSTLGQPDHWFMTRRPSVFFTSPANTSSCQVSLRKCQFGILQLTIPIYGVDLYASFLGWYTYFRSWVSLKSKSSLNSNTSYTAEFVQYTQANFIVD